MEKAQTGTMLNWRLNTTSRSLSHENWTLHWNVDKWVLYILHYFSIKKGITMNLSTFYSNIYLWPYSMTWSWRLGSRNGIMCFVWLQPTIIFNLQTLKPHWAPLIDEQWLGQCVTHIIIAIVTFNWHLWGTYPSLNLIPAQDISNSFPNSLNESRKNTGF